MCLRSVRLSHVLQDSLRLSGESEQQHGSDAETEIAKIRKEEIRIW